MKAAFGEATARAIQAGDQQALLTGLVANAALWFELAGSHIGFRKTLGAVNCAAHGAPDSGVLLAAAIDLYDVLELSPQGREALANFGRKPVLQEPKSE